MLWASSNKGLCSEIRDYEKLIRVMFRIMITVNV